MMAILMGGFWEGFPPGILAHGSWGHLTTALQQFQVKGDLTFLPER